MPRGAKGEKEERDGQRIQVSIIHMLNSIEAAPLM